MHQSFKTRTRPEDGPPRLKRLRAEMQAERLDAYLVPRADAHQGETVAPCDERLAWLTGFTGSAGIAAVTAEEAALFVDGRYALQARAQAADCFAKVDWPATRPGAWLAERLATGARVGYDPWLHTAKEIDALSEALGGRAAPVATENLVDRIWTDRPPPPAGRVRAWPDALAGESAAQKRARIAATLAEAGHAHAVLTLPDSIAWLLNIRGSDIARTPVVLGFAILSGHGNVALFADAEKFGGLDLGDGVTLHAPEAFAAALGELSGPVRVDRSTAPVAVSALLDEAGVEIAWGDDPCILPKARKSEAEIAATREAHLRDGAAMVEFLAWFDDRAPRGGLTEIDAARALEERRRATNSLLDIAFDTISGSGPNGAIVHYRVTEDTDREIRGGELYLVDSGGQYEDGTTDVTRTVLVGDVPPEGAVDAFTRVLQGLVAISTARFPRGLAGRDIDALARAALWRAGLDYDHGTGHGVGVYLNVHEGPARISRLSEVALEPGMILSNEPGYYREGAFGIRLENLVVVREAPPLGDGRDQLGFETLTWVPIDRRLIDTAALAPWERRWIDEYHAEVRRRIAPRVSEETREWLDRVTQPL